ncbi:MAG TPA: hypothetical protein VGA36_09640 [Nitriliruptorales bacterium]
MTTDVASDPASRLDTLPPESLDVGYWFEPGVLSLGHETIAWAERWLIQPNGPHAGRPWRFTARQKRFLLHWYELDESGGWKYHHGVRRLAKGSGKSPFAAALSLIEFCAHCRLERIVDPEHPDPRRRVSAQPVAMPWVQIAATAESQTKNTMRMVRAFAAKGSKVVAAHALDPGKTVYYRQPEGTLEVITSSATAAEGAETSHATGDETEHWRPSNGGVDLADTLGDNLAKSGSRMVETCNSWVPGDESVAEATWDAWVAQEEGRVRTDTKILYDAVVAPPDTDMADRASLYRSLEHVYADCPWMNLPVIANKIWDLRSKPDESSRKYLNRPTAPLDAWTTKEAWDVLADPRLTVDDAEEIVAFFDGSKSDDATALVGCRVSDGHVFKVGVWEAPAGPSGERWEVPVVEVDQTVDLMFERWTVRAFFGDVREWESFVHTAWPARHGEGLLLWAHKAGRNASPIAWDMRSHTMDFTRAAEATLTDIIDGEISHDGDAAVARHVVNARRRPNRWGTSIGKESRASARKIDGAVCVIGARMVRRFLLASPEWAEHNKSKSARVWGY